MSKETKQERIYNLLKIILIIFIILLFTFIHIWNIQDIRNVELNIWQQVRAFCVNHRLLVMIVDLFLAILLICSFNKNNNSNNNNNNNKSD